MNWNPADFHPLAFSLLQAHTGKPLALKASEFQLRELPSGLMSTPAEQLFPHARDAKAALAGLLLSSGHWELSHQVAQEIASREGSYWHAIVHRIEPDFSNAEYWFRRVGEHPIFEELHTQADAVLSSTGSGWRLKNSWDPHLFLIWCEEACGLDDCEKHSIACEIQRLEYDLLLAWSALK